MPKKVSKRKTTRRPKKVSRKKSKRVTKKKPKYKRRRRRFGSSLHEEPIKRGNLRTFLASFFTPQNPVREKGINTFAKRFAEGDPESESRNKTPNYKALVEGLTGARKVMGLYNTFTSSDDFRIIGPATDIAIKKRHQIFHTWLVAIISAILQLINEVGRSKNSKYYRSSSVEAKYLDVLSNPESLQGIIEYTRAERSGKTRISNFDMVTGDGNRLVGFTWTFGSTYFDVSMVGQIDGTHLVINTIFTDLENRMLQAGDEIAKAGGLFYQAVSAYRTIINLRNGNIQSSQVSQDNNSVTQLTEGLGNMTMTVNPMTTINTNVQTVNKSTNPFANFKDDTKKTSDDNNPFTEFGPEDNDGPNPFAEFGGEEFVDGKPKAGPEITYLFGRRKRKRKVSKKKVSKKKGPSAALKKLCKRLKVKLTTKRGGKRVYKSEKVLKTQCKKASKKSSFGKSKKKVSKKKGPSAALKKLCKRLKVKLTVKRGKKRVYKSEKVLKAQCKKAAKKSSFGKKKKRRRKRTSK